MIWWVREDGLPLSSLPFLPSHCTNAHHFLTASAYICFPLLLPFYLQHTFSFSLANPCLPVVNPETRSPFLKKVATIKRWGKSPLITQMAHSAPFLHSSSGLCFETLSSGTESFSLLLPTTSIQCLLQSAPVLRQIPIPV